MIRLKRLNGTDFVLNCDLIKLIEALPDTMITLVSGEKIMVRDGVEAVIQATMLYKKKLFQEPLVENPGKTSSESNRWT